MANIYKLIESVKSVFGRGQKQEDTYELNGLHNGAVMQPTANNGADLEAAGGGVVTAQSGNSLRVDRQGNGYAIPTIPKFISSMLVGTLGFHSRTFGVRVDADERVTRGGDEVVGVGAGKNGRVVMGEQQVGAATKANSIVITASRIIGDNDLRTSATHLSSGEDDIGIELCYRPTTSSASPLVPAAAYYEGDDVEAQRETREATVNAHSTLTTPITLKSKTVAWLKSIFHFPALFASNSADHVDTDVDVEAPAQAEEAPNDSRDLSTFKTKAIAWFKSITVCKAIGITIGFVACFGTLYFGYYQKASYDLQRQTHGANVVANFGA